MPTDAELRERYERRKEQSRLGMARLRAQRKAALASPVSTTVSTTDAPVSTTPPPAPPPVVPTGRPLEERLTPFASRGPLPKLDAVRLLAEKYPELDFDLTLEAALDWLQEPRNGKRRPAVRFFQNWFARADADRKAREAAPPPGAQPSWRGLMLPDGKWVPPAAYQRNTERTYKAAGDYSADDLARSDAERERVLAALPERLRGKSRWRAG